MSVKILQGDCREVMKTLAENSVDAIVTDPPYGLGFMGKEWDSFTPGDSAMRRRPEMDAVNAGMSRQGGRQRAGEDYQKRQARDMREFQAWCETWAVECLRVLKPGGYILSFGGTRTYHRMVCAIEDAGFEIRDQIGWLFGSGFPKSHNGEWGGTALKPAWEPICMARKSLAGTVEANWREHGTGALNIEDCRIDGEKGVPASPRRAAQGSALGDLSKDPGTGSGWDKNIGRWPANVIHDGSDEVLSAFPDAPGQQRSVGPANGAKPSINTYGDFGPRDQFNPRGDAGSAARFFYCAKASKEDRNAGCEGLPEKAGGMVSNTSGQHITRRDGGAPGPRANHHPTVKPTDLMRYLCRLVTPAGGLVLDPFMGSGSTLKAAELEGFSAIGIELDGDYIEIARRRIAADAPLFAETETHRVSAGPEAADA